MFELVVTSVVSIYFTVLLLGFLLRSFFTGNPDTLTKFEI